VAAAAKELLFCSKLQQKAIFMENKNIYFHITCQGMHINGKSREFYSLTCAP
jgi:hypothetical protein